MTEPVIFLSRYADRLVILDKIHRLAELFQPLRGIIDQGRSRGQRVGRFLLLGSASIELLRQSGESLAGYPVAGAGREGFVIENLLAMAPVRTQASFFRTAAGAEIDLLLGFLGGQLWAVEIKNSLSPRLEKGFYLAPADVKPSRAFVVYPGEKRYPLSETIEVVSLDELCTILAGRENGNRRETTVKADISGYSPVA